MLLIRRMVFEARMHMQTPARKSKIRLREMMTQAWHAALAPRANLTEAHTWQLLAGKHCPVARAQRGGVGGAEVPRAALLFFGSRSLLHRSLPGIWGRTSSAHGFFLRAMRFGRIAGSFRRVLLGPTGQWPLHAGMRPAALGQFTLERQESLQRYCGLLFQP